MASPLLVFNDNGGWCWYQDERVIVQNNKLIIGSIANGSGTGGSARSGDIEVTTCDLDVNTITRTTLHDNLQADDHDLPAFLALPDGYVISMYTRHLSDSLIHYRKTANPYDTTIWSSDVQLTRGASTSYSNLFRLSAENGGSGRIYDFYRGENYNPNFIISNNNGASWTYGGWLIRKNNQRPYVKYTSNNTDKVFFVCSNAHPREYWGSGFGGTSIYAGYVYQGGLYKLDGTKLRDITTTDAAAPESLTLVYQGDNTHRAWPTDIHLDSGGHPYLAFSVQVASSGSFDGSDLRYFYARWDGSQISTVPLAHAGTALYADENDYSGLVALDPNNPDVLYISTNADPVTGAALISGADGRRHYEILKGTSSDSGNTWAWEYITRDSAVNNIRPIVPVWDGPDTILLWMRGTYTSYTNYNTQIVGMFNPQPLPQILNQPDSVTAIVGGTAEFKITAAGAAPLNYAWYKYVDGVNDTPVGGNAAILTINNIVPDDIGQYYCNVSNEAGSINSVFAGLMMADLSAWWPLDGDYGDATGNGYDASAAGSPAFEAGVFSGQAVSLTNNSYLAAANSGNLTLSRGGTVSAWVKTAGLNAAWASIVSKGQFGWRLSRNNAANAISFGMNAAGDEYRANGDIPIVDDTWHHVAATYDIQRIKLYVDGQLDAEASTPPLMNELTDPVYIGSQTLISHPSVYVDATAANTALANGSCSAWWAANTSTSDLLWDYRTDYGLNYAGQFNTTGRDIFQAREDTCGQLVTTVTGLTPGQTYRVDVAYHSKSSSENWNITAAFAPIATDAAGTVTSGITYSWDGGVMYGVDTVAGVNTGNVQAGIWLLTGTVGTTAADASGRIMVYIDDIMNESHANNRTWYDGLYVEEVASEPYPSLFWDGLIDDVRIYDFAMDADTIGLLYQNKSCYRTDPFDLNEDCLVNLDDLVSFCSSWLQDGFAPGTTTCIARPALDITGPQSQPDCRVDLYEFEAFGSKWMDCYLLPASDCL